MFLQNESETRMHSSRMHIGRSSTIMRGMSMTETPWAENPLRQRPPWTEKPPWQRPPLTETPLDRDPPDRDQPGQRLPGQRPHMDRDPPTPLLDRDPTPNPPVDRQNVSENITFPQLRLWTLFYFIDLLLLIKSSWKWYVEAWPKFFYSNNRDGLFLMVASS